MRAPRKLPVATVLAEAFALPWSRRGVFCRALAFCAAVIVATQVGWWLAYDQLNQPMRWAAWAVNGVLWILFAVICHRLVLLQLPPGDVAIVPGWGRRETLFLAWMTLVSLAITAAMMAVLAPYGIVVASVSKELFESTYQYAGAVVAMYLFARVSLVFPATAIDARMNPLQAWRLTRGNGWRLVVIVGVLPWAFGALAGFISGDEPGVVQGVVVTALATVFLTVEISALSLSYRELSKDPGPEDDPAPGVV